ncbi:hypothetical protein DPS36_20255 [Salmonella enterica subsp. enterica]|nr:hypothetical protein [Salmonella enterica subsp. enterica]
MKFTELPDHVIEAAAKTLSRELEGVSTWEDDERTEKAKAVAECVRDSFIQLCSGEKNVTQSYECRLKIGILRGDATNLAKNEFKASTELKVDEFVIYSTKS